MKWKFRFSTLQGCMALLLIACCVAFCAAAQYPWAKTKNTCHHGTDIWEHVKVRPVQFTGFEGVGAQWKYQDAYTMKTGEYTFLDEGKYFSKNGKEVNMLYLMAHKDSTWITFTCDQCRGILRAYELK